MDCFIAFNRHGYGLATATVPETATAGLELVVVMAPERDAARPTPAANDQTPHDFASAMRRVERDFYQAV